MWKIFKYEIIRRKSSITIFLAIMGALTLISLISLFVRDNISILHMKLGWMPITIIGLICIPLFHVFTCGSGHINELLMADTNYLMLTIPVEPWKILLGRMLAGLLEILIYSLGSTILGSILGITAGIKSNDIIPTFSEMNQLFALVYKNFTSLTLSLFTFINLVLLTGSLIMFIKIMAKSLIKRKGLAKFVSIILFIFLFFQFNEKAILFSNNINWTIPIKVFYFNNNFPFGSFEIEYFPILLPVSYFILATIFFIGSSWLLKYKAEV